MERPIHRVRGRRCPQEPPPPIVHAPPQSWEDPPPRRRPQVGPGLAGLGELGRRRCYRALRTQGGPAPRPPRPAPRPPPSHWLWPPSPRFLRRSWGSLAGSLAGSSYPLRRRRIVPSPFVGSLVLKPRWTHSSRPLARRSSHHWPAALVRFLGRVQLLPAGRGAGLIGCVRREGWILKGKPQFRKAINYGGLFRMLHLWRASCILTVIRAFN
uniref:potassium/sodium hyperpolarization-activated cyclic nucleotide-gated channel 2-like n=1 Tax=Macaca mulatta TaxID=9544 RepID=UPI0010A21E09|nr:potassium/sodium hyperpolarization-activated cyclic nucleotide-gated channel 2-like [Macaca mulatta]